MFSYVTVDKANDANMFFWLFDAENGNQNAPLIVWLQGGPGTLFLCLQNVIYHFLSVILFFFFFFFFFFLFFISFDETTNVRSPYAHCRCVFAQHALCRWAGCSSLLGLILENGPYHLLNGELAANPNSWTKNFRVLYLDNPVGSGFSYVTKEAGYLDTEPEVGFLKWKMERRKEK
jgi:hypothetical protein